MVEYVGVTYVEVIQHAFLPAIISYIALVYIVHLEAMKADMKGLPRRTESTLVQTLLVFVMSIIGLVVLSGVVYYGMGWIKTAFGPASPWIAAVLTAIAYVGLAWYGSRFPSGADPNSDITELPQPGPTIKSGLHYLLPVVVLVWCLTVERFSPGLSAFWATVFMVFIVLTQRPLMAYFQQVADKSSAVRQGWDELLEGLVSGARNMIGIGVATAAAGIVVGTVTLTGIGLVMTEFVEFISGGSLILMLVFTAIISLVLGMGLPTTANYIVVSTLMAPVIVTLGAQSGLIVPLIAVHLFVFYFGILADDTPPVGLAAFAAAAISGGDPIKTGLQGFFLVKSRLWESLALVLWESLALVLVAFTLFRPGYWWDTVYPASQIVAATQIEAIAEGLPAKTSLQINVAGETLDGKRVSKLVNLPLGPSASGFERLSQAGIEVRIEDGKVFVDNLVFGSPAELSGLDFDWEIKGIQVEASRPPKQLMFIPALILLGLIIMLQRGRRARPVPAAA